MVVVRGGSCSGVSYSSVKYQAGNCLGGGLGCPGGHCLSGHVVWDGSILGGNYPSWSCLGRSFPDGNCWDLTDSKFSFFA